MKTHRQTDKTAHCICSRTPLNVTVPALYLSDSEVSRFALLEFVQFLKSYKTTLVLWGT